ncbi:hypothetical protein LEP1GSC024_2871 [Leptospira noguchii str. 2001034031]|uniref:Uncharacterized protein n=1 Tax=Leptospira noguchii str. 2001034031 TaxID=1193053 RepID=M6Y5T1_9LEPT|nr:hypothetical protein LEP1GSC024_2871 [Leptospira noguchii str. 2001034031]
MWEFILSECISKIENYGSYLTERFNFYAKLRACPKTQRILRDNSLEIFNKL